MHAVVRRYSGPGARELTDVLFERRQDVEALIRGVNGLVSYSLIRTDEGCMSVTVCQDKAGTDESVQVAANWIRENARVGANPPQVTEGDVFVQI